MLTVACVWIKSETYKNPEWVVKLYRMVDRWIGLVHRPYRFVCITNCPNELCDASDGTDIEWLNPVIAPPFDKPKWWYKLNLFRTQWQVMGIKRVLYLDLDVVVKGSLADLVSFPSDFVTAPSSGMPMRGHDFNTSVMMFNTEGETFHHIRKTLPLVDYDKFAGDQQWLSSLKMRVDLFPSRWIHKYLPGKGSYVPPEEAKVVLMIQGGKNKALIEAGHDWITDYWR